MALIRIPVRIEHPFTGGVAMNVWNGRIDEGVTGISGGTRQLLDDLEAFYSAASTYMPGGTDVILGEGMILNPFSNPTYVSDDRRIIQVANANPNTNSTLLAVCISWRTSAASRSGRGRTFIGPLNKTAAEIDGTPTAGLLSNLRNAADDLVAAVGNADGTGLGVYSVKQGVLRDFTGATVADRFAYLSSRRD